MSVAVGGLVVACAAPLHAQELGPSLWLPMVDPDKGAQETFDSNRLGIISGGGGWRVFRGKRRESVSRHDFFITVGRPDLDRQDSSRQTVHGAMVYGGYAVAIVGGALVYAKVVRGGFDPPLAVGGSMLAAGALSVWIGGTFEGPAMSPTEAESLAQLYNERLLLHLKDPVRSNRLMVRDWPLRIVPWIGSGGAGLIAAATF